MPAEGKLQKTILDTLHSNPSILPLFQNRVLWEIALARNGVHRTGITFGSTTSIIEEGQVRKSFEINFRRAVKSLAKSGKIVLTKKRITDLNEILLHLPYLTNKLQVFQIRQNLIPTVREFISEGKSSIADKNFDPFEYQLKLLKKENIDEYNELLEGWKRIEQKILKLPQNVESERFDQWLDVLLWGRYHFRSRKRKIISTPSVNSKTQQEERVAELIMNLTDRVKAYDYFKIGDVKTILYALFTAPRHGRIIIKDELKDYLFKKRGDLLKALPGHKGSFHHTQYSPLLELLFNRHIFRELSFLNLI